MKTVYKYPIQIADEQEVSMPYDAKVIHVGLDPQGTPCLWAKVESNNRPEPVRVLVVGTGGPIPYMPYHEERHVGSFTQGPFVWHVFLG